MPSNPPVRTDSAPSMPRGPGAPLWERLLESDWERLALSRLDSVLPPDIFLFVLDSVSGLDVLDPADPQAVSGSLPGLYEFARRSVLYPEARTTASGSLPAHASAFTGLYPWVHGVHARGADRLAEQHPTLASHLGGDGYGTFALSGNPAISSQSGLTRGFKHAAWRPSPPTAGTLSSTLAAGARALGRWSGHRTAPAVPSSAWIGPAFETILSLSPEDVPLFGFVNLSDAAPTAVVPHGATEDDRERLRLLHEAGISVADARLEQLLASLRRHGRWENSLVLVTSDRGSSIPGDPALPTGAELDEQSSRIPMLVKYPGGTGEAQTAQGAASLVDLLPTALAEVGLRPAPPVPGVGLRSLISQPRPGRLLALSDGLRHHSRPHPARVSPTGGWHSGPGVISFSRAPGTDRFQPLGPALIAR